MNNTEAVVRDSELKLSESFNKRHALNVTNRTAQLNDAHFGLFTVLCDWNLGHIFHPLLDGVRYVRDN